MEKSIWTSIESLGINILYVKKWLWGFCNDYLWLKYLSRHVCKLKESEEIEQHSVISDVVCFTVNTNGTMEFDG